MCRQQARGSQLASEPFYLLHLRIESIRFFLRGQITQSQRRAISAIPIAPHGTVIGTHDCQWLADDVWQQVSKLRSKLLKRKPRCGLDAMDVFASL